jgi:hypothetical protein
VAKIVFDTIGAKAISGAISFVALALALTPVNAHSLRNGTEAATGISIPNLTHGQLHVLAQYKSAVGALADRQSRPSLEVRTLHNYVNLQFAYCLWGLVPNSISNEDSPFNACSHAYLAASKALLDRLRQSEEAGTRAHALAQEIEFAMVQNATASEICANGIEPFNTAQIIMPEWRGISFNPLGLLLGVFVFAAAAGTVAVGMMRGRVNARVR